MSMKQIADSKEKLVTETQYDILVLW